MLTDEEWQKERAEMLARAKIRVSMFVGSEEHGHRIAIQSVIRMLWQARYFYRPLAAHIDLSPNQYVIRCDCGPLIRPLQNFIPAEKGRELLDGFGKNFEAYEKPMREKQDWKAMPRLLKRSWYCLTGPTGPRLHQPSWPSVLARKFVWGLRVNDGLWCQAYIDGWPVSAPFLHRGKSSPGIFAAAELNPTYFTGLPFTEEDAAKFSEMRDKIFDDNEPKWQMTGNLTVRWHANDNLLRDEMLTADGIESLLGESKI